MLEFFRRYQRYFFILITVVVIASFTLFGTYQSFSQAEESPDVKIGQKIDGSPLMLSEVQKLSRFLSTDREDSKEGRGLAPNLCNQGVIRYDFIRDGLADLIVAEYFDQLKVGFEERLQKAKRFKPYVHPAADFLSAKNIWDHLAPDLNLELASLQGQAEASFAVFSSLERLYQLQSRLQPEMLRQILIYQHRQYPSLPVDQRLSYEDLSLFGFHTASDWFGHHFVDLISEFILNAAAAAEQKGYRVSLQEATGDLIHIFQESSQKLSRPKSDIPMNFHSHLASLGLNEKSASELWRKVLLFRRYFQDIGEAAFVDQLPYKDFAKYAKEEAVVQVHSWPVSINSAEDLAAFQFYIKAVCPKQKEGLPTAVLSADEVEKKYPQLVQTTYRADVAEVTKKQIALKASLKQVWDWQTSDEQWPLLKKEFSLSSATNKEERFKILEKLDSLKRSQIDAWSREKIVDQNPSWVQEALAAAPKKEKTWTVSGNEEPVLRSDGVFYLVENQAPLGPKRVLTFHEALPVLSKQISLSDSSYDKEKNPFAMAAKEALIALQKNRDDPRWIQSGLDPLLDQFKLSRKEQSISRSSKEEWMKEKAFIMLPDFWSPIHVADNGQISFFYLQEKKVNPAPILDQLLLGKQTLAADAKAYVAERLLKVVKTKKAIVIPVQKDNE